MRRPLGPPQRRGHMGPKASRGHQGSCSGKARKALKAEKFFLAETVEFFSLRSCPNCSAPAASGLHPCDEVCPVFIRASWLLPFNLSSPSAASLSIFASPLS